MRDSGRKFRVGLLVIGTGLLFLGLLLFVVGKTIASNNVVYYILFDDNVKGMALGSKCNFQGVPIGSVSDIRFLRGQTLVELSVDPNRADIQDVTRARLDRLLVTGQVTVELEGWSRQGHSLRPETYIKPVTDPLHKLTRSLPEVLDESMSMLQSLHAMLERIDGMLAGETGRNLEATLHNTERATALLAERMQSTGPRLDQLLDDASSAARALAATAGGPEAVALVTDARTAVHAIATTMTEAQGMLAALRGPSTVAVQTMRSALDEVRGFLRLLRLAPDSVLYGINRPADALAAPGGK
jgi:phospholipid/cholesterol/gamma-HCH transport system substrate-binding protein